MADDPSEARRVRIERLQAEIAAGRYHVPADDVADAVIRFFARDLPQAGPDVSR